MRIITCVFVVFFIFSCKNEIKKPISEIKPEVVKPEKKTEKPEFQEKSFIEFFELFLQNPEFQKSRIDFPVLKNGEEIKSSEWENISTFENGEFYPYLYQNNTAQDNEDTSIVQLKVNVIDFQSNTFTDYLFDKSLEKWKLTGINNSSIDSIVENEFVTFLYQFSQDPDFQKNHMVFPLKATTLELDSISNITSSEIGIEEWEFFDFINEIRFLIIINLPESNENYRHIFLRGIDNGISVEYLFDKINGEWHFIQINDEST
jgi:hypothetical protein